MAAHSFTIQGHKQVSRASLYLTLAKNGKKKNHIAHLIFLPRRQDAMSDNKLIATLINMTFQIPKPNQISWFHKFMNLDSLSRFVQHRVKPSNAAEISQVLPSFNLTCASDQLSNLGF